MLETQELIRQTALKLELLERKETLEAECKLLDAEVHRLRIVAHNEQVDVENMKSPSIKGVFWSITGKKQALLEKEQAEARDAQQSYNFAVAKQESVQHKLRECAKEIAVLGDCERKLRKLISFPEDSSLTLLTQGITMLPQTREKISSLIAALAKVSNLGAFRNGTKSSSALAGTDDKLMAAERNAQSILIQVKGDLEWIAKNLAAFGIEIDAESLEQFKDDYLIDLYTHALITSRVEKVTVALRQIGFQLDAAKPKLVQMTQEQTKRHLREVLDAARVR